jgi:hypothetical protein
MLLVASRPYHSEIPQCNSCKIIDKRGSFGRSREYSQSVKGKIELIKKSDLRDISDKKSIKIPF